MQLNSTGGNKMVRMFYLRGVGFYPAFVQSGTLNHDGKGWPYHKGLKLTMPHRFNFSGANDVGKTTTFAPREGNMPLDNNLQPKERVPKCIWADPFKGIALNCVGLSGPGIRSLMKRNIYQQKTSPHIISIMAIGSCSKQRLGEVEDMAHVIQETFGFQARFGVEINMSCPNTSHDIAKLAEQEKQLAHEAIEQARIVRSGLFFDVPIGLKINPLVTPATVKLIQQAKVYDYLMISNTIPWLQLPQFINWKKLFRSEVSPLTRRGFEQPGGLSGAPLLPIVVQWIREARQAGIKMFIVAGGGILDPEDVSKLKLAGANAISLGSVVFLRPWNVQPIIQRAHEVF